MQRKTGRQKIGGEEKEDKTDKREGEGISREERGLRKVTWFYTH